MIAHELQNIFITRRDTILRTANSELIILFWQIGMQLKHYKDVSKNSIDEKDFFYLENALNKKYGNIFSSNHLNTLELLVDFFTQKDELEALTFFLSWDHFFQILKIKDNKKRNKYIEVTIENNFSAKELEKIIVGNENVIEHFSSGKINIDSILKRGKKDKLKIINDIINCSKRASHNLLNIESAFTSTTFSFYCILVETKPNFSGKGIIHKSSLTNSEEKLYIEIINLIKDFNVRHNNYINSNLNLLFWEISRYINQSSFDKSKTLQQTIQNQIFYIFQKEFDNIFTLKQFYEIIKFSRKVPDFAVANWLSNVLTWKYIRVLLTLPSEEEIIYFSTLTLTKKMNLQNLKKIVLSGKVDKNHFEDSTISEVLKSMRKPRVVSEIKNKKKSVTIVTTIDYEFEHFGSIIHQISVLKSPFFYKLSNYKTRNSLLV